MHLLMAQASSGPNGAYLPAQAITGTNYQSTGACYIRRIMSSSRAATGQVYIYYADDASGTNANIIYHIGHQQAYTQKDKGNLWIPIPAGKYLLTYGVGGVHDTSFSIATDADPDCVTAFANDVTVYKPLKSGGACIQGPVSIERVIFMNTSPNSIGYLYWADDLSGSYANVLRGYAGASLYTELDLSEDCMEVPEGKYLLAHSETGSFSCAVTVKCSQ